MCEAWFHSLALYQSGSMSSLGLSKADPVVVSVEHGVVLANEHVSQNPQGASGGGDVQGHEAAEADGFSGLTFLKNRKTEAKPMFDFIDLCLESMLQYFVTNIRSFQFSMKI